MKASIEKFALLKSGDETVCLDANAARVPCEIAGEVRGEIYGGRGLRIQTNLWRGKERETGERGRQRGKEERKGGREVRKEILKL